MHNWTVDLHNLRQYPKQYKLWKLEQTLTYGLDGKKVKKKDILDNWDYLKNRLDPQRRKYLEFLLWSQPS